MARLGALLAPLLALTTVLVVAPAAADTHGGRLFNLAPRPRLQELSIADIEETLDMLTDLLEETSLPSGEKGFVSQMAAPTLYASTTLCQKHTQIYWEMLKKPTENVWPQLMLDASGKLPDGILVGNLNAFGSLDECLLVKVNLTKDEYPDLDEQERQFSGRYVPVTVSPVPVASGDDGSTGGLQRQDSDDGVGTVIISPTLGLPTGVIGLCVPSSCSSADVQAGLQEMLGENVTATAFPSEVSGQTVDLQPADIVVITLLTLVGVLLLAGTALDVWHGYAVSRQADKLKITSVVDSPNKRLAQMLYIDEPKPAKMQQRKPLPLATWQRVLIAFSLYTNTKKLLDTSTSKGTLTCIHGIRFFSMTWVLMGHATSQLLTYDQNLVVALDWLRTPAFQVIDNATPSVDTFFLLSGVVLAYSFCGAYEKTRTFNIFKFYLHRYLRLTPPLAIMVAVTATIFAYFGNGPLWGMNMEYFQSYCQDNWWYNLLYIQNYTPTDMCLGQTWYLATEMQMFLFSPVVLLPLVWRPLWGALWLGFLTVAFLSLRIAMWSAKNLPPTSFVLNLSDPDTALELSYNYMYPWMRCTVWLTGIGLGYLLHRLRGRQLTLKPWLWLSGWVAAFAIGVSVIFGMVGYQMPWQEYTKAVAVSYGGLHRTAWGVAVAWVIFACVTGYGGPIDTFLSYPGFIPLSRLTYAGYLIHINILLLIECSVKSTLYLDSYRLTYRLLGHTVVTFAAAMLLSLTFEAPFINLEKIMFESKKPAASLGSATVPPADPEVDSDKKEAGPDVDHEAGPSTKE